MYIFVSLIKFFVVVRIDILYIYEIHCASSSMQWWIYSHFKASQHQRGTSGMRDVCVLCHVCALLTTGKEKIRNLMEDPGLNALADI